MRQVQYTIPKTQNQVARIQDDFAPVLYAGETLTAVDVDITERESGVDVTSVMLVPGSLAFTPAGAVSLDVNAGDDNTEYVIGIYGATSQGRMEESYVILPVFNRPLEG